MSSVRDDHIIDLFHHFIVTSVGCLCLSHCEKPLTHSAALSRRSVIDEAAKALRNAAGNYYVNDKSTGSIVAQQPFGGARASGKRAIREPNSLTAADDWFLSSALLFVQEPTINLEVLTTSWDGRRRRWWRRPTSPSQTGGTHTWAERAAACPSSQSRPSLSWSSRHQQRTQTGCCNMNLCTERGHECSWRAPACWTSSQIVSDAFQTRSDWCKTLFF